MPYKEQTIQLGGYVPVAVKPKFTATSYLADSIKTLDARHQKALEQASAIDLALSKIQLNAAEDEWKANYINSIRQQIDDAAQYGSYSTALSTATRLAGKALSDPGLLGRERANQQYEQARKEILARPDINQVTKDRWLATNPYSYQDKVDANGNVIGGTDWNPQWRPVDRYDMSKLYVMAQQLAAKEAGGGESASFLDENGNLVSDPSKGFYGMAVKRGTKWERLSEEKLRNVFNALFTQAPEAMDSLLQDMDDRKWQYNNATDEGKKAFIGSDIIKDDGTFRSPKEYLAHRVNPVLSEMAYNHVWNTADYGNAYALRAKALQDSKTKEAILNARALENNTTMTVPIEIDLKDRAGRSYGTVNNALNTINRLFGNIPVANTPTYKNLLNNNDYRGLAEYLRRFPKGQTLGNDAKKMSEFNAAIRLLREEGDNFNSFIGSLNTDEQNAVKTYFSIQSGITQNDAKDNNYTRQIASAKNKLFSYPDIEGKRHSVDNFILQFDNDTYQRVFFDNLGISEQEANKHGISITTVKGKPAIIVNKNTDLLTNIADANYSLKREHFYSPRPTKLYKQTDTGELIVGDNILSGYTNASNSAEVLNSLRSDSRINRELENKVDNIFKRQQTLKTIEPLQVMPYDDHNTIMLNRMWTSGLIEDDDYKQIKKEFEDNNLKEVAFAMQHPNNYAFYAQTTENGNAVKLSQKEVQDRAENILRAIDQGQVEIAPSEAPTGKGYGTIIRVKGKAKSGNNEEIKNDILYVDALLDGPASQAIARNPDMLLNNSFKTARAIHSRVKTIDGSIINYQAPNALQEYKAAKMLDEVYSDIDNRKLEGRTITSQEAEAVANALIEKAGYSITSDYASRTRPIIISNLLRY